MVLPELYLVIILWVLHVAWYVLLVIYVWGVVICKHQKKVRSILVVFNNLQLRSSRKWESSNVEIQTLHRLLIQKSVSYS
uniref:Putative secreted protein n=1 Tax=Xenopsylla cheopis TaxID=163159 RepID=A0A6M2E1H0_XENCH